MLALVGDSGRAACCELLVCRLYSTCRHKGFFWSTSTSTSINNTSIIYSAVLERTFETFLQQYYLYKYTFALYRLYMAVPGAQIDHMQAGQPRLPRRLPRRRKGRGVRVCARCGQMQMLTSESHSSSREARSPQEAL